VADAVIGISPLDGRAGSGADTAVMVEHSHLGKINLRGDSDDQAFMDGVTEAVGATPPVEANTVATAGKNTILWLGPDEWLVVTPEGMQGAVETALRSALEGRHVSIVDATDARTTIRLHGSNARDVLMKGCPLDLHPRVFGPGQCAQSILAKADILIHQRDDAPTYDIYVLCSFAGYLWDWLADAAKEFT
jgi:sarcosine oxidase subunit gamma